MEYGRRDGRLQLKIFDFEFMEGLLGIFANGKRRRERERGKGKGKGKGGNAGGGKLAGLIAFVHDTLVN